MIFIVMVVREIGKEYRILIVFLDLGKGNDLVFGEV